MNASCDGSAGQGIAAWLDEDEDDDSTCQPPEWDEPDEDDSFDPEPVDDELLDEFDPGEEPDEEEPPEELWNDGDWQ